jgi:hypothetical protein
MPSSLTRLPAIALAFLIGAPALAQMQLPAERIDRARIYQDEDVDDGDDDTAPAVQIAPETLRRMQTRPTIPLPVLRNLTEPARWHVSTARVNAAGNEQRTVPGEQRVLEPVAALSAFSLRFQNGDHKLRRMAVLDEDRFVRFSFADQDSNDPFEAQARWLVISAGAQHEVSGNGGGTFHLPLEPGPPGHTAVLTGFDIQRQGGTDANVRSFGIWLEADEDGRPVARVTLLDDMGQDFRGLAEATFAGMAASLIPTAENLASHAVAVDGLSRFGASGGPRPYAATIQYAWIPDALITRAGAAAGGNDREFDNRRAIALQGFYFHFGNEDHHLLEVGVWPDPQRGIRYRDNNWDDPVQWEVQYVELNDEMRD